MQHFHIIIPARFASLRLPGKPLLDIAGKTLLQRTYEAALLCSAKTITIATDDARIQENAESFGAAVCMTSTTHQNGTERLAEAVEKLGLSNNEIVVNIQGDEPLMPAAAVEKVVHVMTDNATAGLTTLCCPLICEEDILNPNIVKVVKNKADFALYFSRAPIPWNRDGSFASQQQNAYYRHVGLYAYRVSTLKAYSNWEMSPIEALEKLEQLRMLAEGIPIYVATIAEPLPPGVDTATDLALIRNHFA
jgi:3-deoxy-manno-octulosonate cytidylyltransferase (CMP-KDO synthetase)